MHQILPVTQELSRSLWALAWDNPSAILTTPIPGINTSPRNIGNALRTWLGFVCRKDVQGAVHSGTSESNQIRDFAKLNSNLCIGSTTPLDFHTRVSASRN